MALDKSNVFVKYLPSELDDLGLQTLFSSFGEIVSSKVMVDHQTGSSLGYGFVRFADPNDAQVAIQSMTGQRVANKILLCKLSNTSPNSSTPMPSSNLYIKPLLPRTTEDDLRVLFERFGPINTCKVMTDKLTGDATLAVQKMNGVKLEEEAPALVVRFAESEHQRASRKARANQGWVRALERAERESMERNVERVERSPSPNYFNLSQMQAALYEIPTYMPKGYSMSYLPMGYPYLMPLSPHHHLPVSPIWRPQYQMNTQYILSGEIGQH